MITISTLLAAHAQASESAIPLGRRVPESTVGRVTRHPLAANAAAHSIVAGPDGNLWFVFNDRRIGRMLPDGTVATFTHPQVDGLVDLVAGPDGNVWFTFSGSDTLYGGVGRISSAGVITVVDSGYTVELGEIVVGPDGNLWFAGSGIARVTPAGTVTWFDVAGDDPQADTRILTVGSDGRLWHDLGSRGEVSTHVGAMSTSGVDTLVALSEPLQLATLRPGPSGAVWFYEWDADPRFGPLAPDGAVTSYSSRTNQIYYELVLGPDGNLWGPAYNRGLTSGIVRIAPDGKVLFFEVGNVTGLTFGPGGDLWFTDRRAAGRIVVKVGPARRPDVRIRGGTKPWTGNNAYARAVVEGVGQGFVASGPPGHTASLRLSAQNDGDAAEALTVRGQGSTSTLTVAYFAGSTNVTVRVVAGTYRTPVLAPGAEHQLRMTLTPTSRAAFGSQLKRSVTVRSSDADVRDTLFAGVFVHTVVFP